MSLNLTISYRLPFPALHLCLNDFSRPLLITSCECQRDIKPPIRISKADFVVFAKDKPFLDRQGFVNMMREQMHTYIQSRLSSKSEFWNDSPFAFNSIGPLKYLLLDLFKMKQQMDQAAANVSSTTPKQPISARIEPRGAANRDSSATSGSSTGSATEICAIGELVLQLGRAGEAGDMVLQIEAISERLLRLRETALGDQNWQGAQQKGSQQASPIICSLSRERPTEQGRKRPPALATGLQLGLSTRKPKAGAPGPGGPSAGSPPGDGMAESQADGAGRSPVALDPPESSVGPRRMESSGPGLVARPWIRPQDEEANQQLGVGALPAQIGSNGGAGGAGGALFHGIHGMPRRRTSPLLLERLTQSEVAGGRKGARRAAQGDTSSLPSTLAGIQGQSAASMHYKAWPSDVVMVGSGVNSPVGRGTIGSCASARSIWIEPTLL